MTMKPAHWAGSLFARCETFAQMSHSWVKKTLEILTDSLCNARLQAPPKGICYIELYWLQQGVKSLLKA